jgi:hypothetical protein
VAVTFSCFEKKKFGTSSTRRICTGLCPCRNSFANLIQRKQLVLFHCS